MIQSRTQSYRFIDDPSSLDDALHVIASASRIAVDTEADSRHHYPEKVCLIQIGAEGEVFVLDPLSGLDLARLRDVFEDERVEKVLHGADFDIRGLNRDFGFVFRNVYDTNIAARFAGLERFGLAALLEDLLSVTIPKDSKLQRADWSQRPLSDEALAYAAMDVQYLESVRNAIDERVRALGRTEWVREECERMEEVRYTPPDPETAFLGVKGAHLLGGNALAVLKELHAFREAEARRINRPTAYVMPAEAMTYLANRPDADLFQVPRLSASVARRHGKTIRAAIKRGVEAAPYTRPEPQYPPRPRPTPEQMARLTGLKAWRNRLGEQLDMDPSLLWPMRSLERLAREPETFEEELASTEIRRWQREAFGALLKEALAQTDES